MLVINKDLWESDRIVKISSSGNWNSADAMLMVKCLLDDTKEMLEKLEGKPAVVLIDCNKGEEPPLKVFMEFFGFFNQNKALLSQKLNFTIMYIKRDDELARFNTILKLHRPVRPIVVARTNAEIKKFILERDIMEAMESNFDEEEYDENELVDG